VNFLPTYLKIVEGFSSMASSLTYASFLVIGIAANPVVGRLGGRIGHPTVAAGLSMSAAIALTLMVLGTSTGMVLADVAFMASG